MHATPRRLLALLSVLGGLVAFTSSCGGQPPTVCSACTYHTASWAVTATQLQGGSIVSAVMQTEVEHRGCPYGGSGSCSATLAIDVKCKTPGVGNFSISRRPNGFSDGATSTTKDISLVVALPNGGRNVTLTIPVTLTATSDTTATSPCGGSTTPTVDY